MRRRKFLVRAVMGLSIADAQAAAAAPTEPAPPCVMLTGDPPEPTNCAPPPARTIVNKTSNPDGTDLYKMCGYGHFPFKDDEVDIEHVVYTKGDGPPVLLMHELPGMTQECIWFADELADRGFTVYMPLLFGAPLDDNSFGATVHLCIGREFRVFSGSGGSPIGKWLKKLAEQICQRAGSNTVGVIGMCLTGNFAISLIADTRVVGAVSSQPALPLGYGQDDALAMSPGEIAASQASDTPFMCLRFSEDQISSAARYKKIKATFEKQFIGIVVDSGEHNTANIRREAHSVLTGDFHDCQGHPTRKARDQVVAFLHARLSPPSEGRELVKDATPR